MVVQESVYTI